jgi:hypothetical protein
LSFVELRDRSWRWLWSYPSYRCKSYFSTLHSKLDQYCTDTVVEEAALATLLFQVKDWE